MVQLTILTTTALIILAVLIAIVSILYSIWIIGICKGKFKLISLLLLLIAIAIIIKIMFFSDIFLLLITGNVILENTIPRTYYAETFINFFIIILVFLILYIMKKMIDNVNKR